MVPEQATDRPDAAEKRPANSSQTADRAFYVLEVLRQAHKPLSLSDVSARCGLAPAITHRLLRSLISNRFVSQEEDSGRYRLGLGILEFAYEILNLSEVRVASIKAMNELSQLTNETVHLGLLDQNEVVYIDRRDSSHSIRLTTTLGRRGELYCTGLGKAILAHFPEDAFTAYLHRTRFHKRTPTTITDPGALHAQCQQIRDQGYALDLGENRALVLCVAAPIFNASQQVVAAMSVSAHESRLDVTKLHSLSSVVMHYAKEVSETLGYV